MTAEGVVPVLLMLLLTASVVISCVYAAWPAADDSPKAAKDVSPTPTAAAAASGPESLEGVLVAQLARGQISRRQYLRAMELLAARDDERHPLAVPPETGPAET